MSEVAKVWHSAPVKGVTLTLYHMEGKGVAWWAFPAKERGLGFPTRATSSCQIPLILILENLVG